MDQKSPASAPLAICAVILALAAAYFARPLLAPVTFAVFVVAVVWPVQDALQKRLPKLLALVLALAATLAVLATLGFLVVWGFGRVARWLVENVARFQALYSQAVEWLEAHGVAARGLMAGGLTPSSITSALRQVGGQGYSLFSFAVIAFAFTVLGLLEVDLARRNIARLDNPALRQSLLGAARETSSKLRQYMAVRSLMSVLTGLVVWAFALVAGIELATAWGVIAFVLNYIPFLGPLVATVFPALFALVQFESWDLGFLVFAGLNGVQFFIGSYLEPRIAGARLSLSPFMVLFAVFFWSFLWGVAGAFIGVPILIATLTVCAGREDWRWLAILMSGGEADGEGPRPGLAVPNGKSGG
jgi:predicted PurR-regulated permease PerM